MDPQTIYEMVVAGNSTMRDIFFRLNVYSIGQIPYRSITELEMAEGKRTTTSLTDDGEKAVCCRFIPRRGFMAADHQRPRRRGCGGVHAGRGSGE